MGDDLHGRAAVPSALLDLNLVDGKTVSEQISEHENRTTGPIPSVVSVFYFSVLLRS